MKTYVRIEKNVVAEILQSAIDPAVLFYPTLRWVDVTAKPEVQVGDVQSPSGFAAPPPAAPVIVTTPSLADLQSELAGLSARIASLSPLR